MITPKKGQKIVIAMSGGVDSSVAALMLKEQGYEVIGMMLKLWSEKNTDANRCCTPDSIDTAREIADQLDIPFYVRDYQTDFKEKVVNNFISTYSKALTPNPCLICNKEIRFGKLLKEALGLGAEYLATGHYARIVKKDDSLALFKGYDTTKDQSYVLYQLDQKQLSHTFFPLGELNKPQIRAMAEKANLPVAKKPDSQDLCFIGDENYHEFLRRHTEDIFINGEIQDSSGKTLGSHNGLPGFTIGQRKGLGISNPFPLYVTALDIKENKVIVGSKNERQSKAMTTGENMFISGKQPTDETEITVKIRYTAKQEKAILKPLNKTEYLVEFQTPVFDVTPGQAAVYYLNDEVLGGGIIVDRLKLD